MSSRSPRFPGLPMQGAASQLFPVAGGPWPPATTLAGFMPGLAALASWPPPRIDVASYGQFLDLQRKVWQMWVDSAQTIALRFMLAPPWMAYSPWVREEWVRMVSEKVAASTEAMNVAVKAGMTGQNLNPRSLQKTAQSVIDPFSSRTSSNASRLGSRVLRGDALVAAMPALPVKRTKAKARPAATATRRSTRRG